MSEIIIQDEEKLKRLQERKCFTCGGPIVEQAGHKFRCEYCNTLYPQLEPDTEPEIQELADMRILDRDFDRAYEKSKAILQRKPNACAELYWQAVLAKFGVIYIEEDGKMLPTFFGVKYDNKRDKVVNSEDVRTILKITEGEERANYEAQARELDKNLNLLSDLIEKEEDYDVFISFKKTVDVIDKNGKTRKMDTDDYHKAEELYGELTKRKIRAFFSPVDIEQNVGAQGKVYEPKILRALQSSQAMILFGSETEYLEATWVENEWRRYKQYINMGVRKPDSLILLYNREKPTLPSALTRGVGGSIQLKSVDYFASDYVERVIDAIAPFVGQNRFVKKVNIVRTETRKTARTIQSEELKGYNIATSKTTDTNLTTHLKNVESDLKTGTKSSYGRAVSLIKKLRKEYPDSGKVRALEMVVNLGVNDIKQLSDVIAKTTDWKGLVGSVEFIIDHADNERFYKDFVGTMYDTVFNMVSDSRAAELFNVIKDRKYVDDGRDYRRDSIRKIMNRARSVLNGGLFRSALDALNLDDEAYKQALVVFAEKALEQGHFDESLATAQQILKLDNSITEVIDIKNLAALRVRNWYEVFRFPQAYERLSDCMIFKEAAGFFESDEEIDEYLDLKADAVIGGMPVTSDATYIAMLDNFVGLIRDDERRRETIRKIVNAATGYGRHKVGLHYCELLITGEDPDEDAQTYWQMTLLSYGFSDEKELKKLRTGIDENEYFRMAQANADEGDPDFAEYLARVRSEQLDAVDKNLAHDRLMKKRKNSRTRGYVTVSALSAALVAEIVMILLALFGIGPLFEPFYFSSLALFTGKWYFLIALVPLGIMLAVLLTKYKRIKKEKRHAGKIIASEIVTVIFAAAIIILPCLYQGGIENDIVEFGQNVQISDDVVYLYQDVNYNGKGKYAVKRIMPKHGVTDIEVSDNFKGEAVKYFPDSALKYCKKTVVSVTFGNNIDTVGTDAFKDCKNLKYLNLRMSEASLSVAAFTDCTDLTIFTGLSEAPSNWRFLGKSNISKVVYNAINEGGEVVIENNCVFFVKNNKATLIKYTGSKTQVVIPAKAGGATVVAIEANAFDRKALISSVTIGKDVKTIGDEAFKDCSSLVEIKYQGSLTDWLNVNKGFGWKPSGARVTYDNN